MANRTKSFFDQDHPAKQKPVQWHRSNTNKAPLGEASPNIAPSKPPIPATSYAKTKLKAFQFIPGQKEDSDVDAQQVDPSAGDKSNAASADGTANGGLEMRDVPSKHSTSSAPQPLVTGVSSKVPQLQHANTFPSTPSARLPLEDLIGNFDENAINEVPKERSPEEQIGWIAHSSSTLLTPNGKRKRARSSSPSCPNTASQRRETSAFFVANELQCEKTPEGDPTARLWKSYGAAKEAAEGWKLPELDKLFQASPRPLETPAKSTAFRRWASTGNDWPSSKSKRRKTDGIANLALGQYQHFADSAGKSKIAGMVEKIQESLASQKLAQSASNQAAEADAPSSSSPLPEASAGSLVKRQGTSPLQSRQGQRTSQISDAKVVRTLPVKTHRFVEHAISSGGRQSSSNGVRNGKPSTESIIPAPLLVPNKAPLPAYRRPSMLRMPSGSGRQYPVKQSGPTEPLVATTEPGNELEEFGDEFDLCAEDLEELVSQKPLHQRSLHEIPPHPNPLPQEALHELPPESQEVTKKVANSIDDDDDDEFGCDDLDEDALAKAEISATQAYRIFPSEQKLRTLHNPRSAQSVSKPPFAATPIDGAPQLLRYKVKQVIEGEYTNDRGRRCSEKLLMADDERTARPTAITLRDSWASMPFSTNDVIHIAHIRHPISPRSNLPSTPKGQIHITDDESSAFIILHPDHMLSATTVADSFDCLRKAVLQDRIKATGETSKAMVYGKILHEIFQQALAANRWEDAFLKDLVERTVQSHVEGLWELGMKDTVLTIEEITAKMGELAAWAETFVSIMPSSRAVVDNRRDEKMWMSISRLIAIEEHIWSPRFGLKGNIDATIQSTVIDHPKEPAKKLLAPLEVKTGRTTQSPAHRAQTALYTLLLSDRYDITVKAGILYYLESSTMSRIDPPANELRQMIAQRNRLAAYIHLAKHPRTSNEEGSVKLHVPQTQEIENSGLPGLLKNPFKCGKCYAQQSCFTYHALIENGTAGTAGMVDDGKKNHAMVWQEAVGHLVLSAKDRVGSEKLKLWFTKWDRLLSFEESEMSRFRKELWTMSSTEREAAGRCFGNLVLVPELSSACTTIAQPAVDSIQGGGKINRYVYVFKRAVRKARASFTEGTQLTIGEPMVVSSESGQWALANGYVTAASKYNITVAVDRQLGDARERLEDFDEDTNHAFCGIMSVDEKDGAVKSSDEQMLYRLDKDEFSNGLALVRNNLVTLMSSHPIHTKLRQQIVFDSQPKFVPPFQQPFLPPSQLGEMNEDQHAAVLKVLNSQDYALILGMPGTGKTSTIAHIIQALLAADKTILLTSFTHTAVDNILVKIREIVPPKSILRLGVPARINPEVQKFCRLAATPRKTVEEIEEAFIGCRIVATTCMGTNHAIFNRRAFDVCIVDEASQITLPTSLGPLLHARKFVLVGDHYQLPPLVQNRRALEGGLDVSLFRQLSEKHPEAVATLGKQYRMCEDIMSLSNVLIYNGQLRCGNEAVAQRTLSVASAVNLQPFHSTQGCRGTCWLEVLTQAQRKVVFASTDALGKDALETLNSGKNITNQLEATLTAQLVLTFLKLGVPGKDIGIITLYRSQLALLRQLFKHAGIGSEVEIDSADRFQGRDKECIILSMVRSNEQGIVGDLLKDWRRVNVALTRARSKLIVLGSRRTLVNNDLLAKFLRLVDERGWTYELPKGADYGHMFDFSSQSTASLLPHSTPSPIKSLRSSQANAPGAKICSPQSTAVSPPRTLTPSMSAGNRSPPKMSSLGKVRKGSPKLIKGKTKSSLVKEQIACEIFEDLTADDI